MRNVQNYCQCCEELLCWRFELHPQLSSSLAFAVCQPDKTLLCFCFMPIPFSYFWFAAFFFFLAHTTLWGRRDGIQFCQNNASSYQERKMFAPFAQALAVKYLVKCLQQHTLEPTSLSTPLLSTAPLSKRGYSWLQRKVSNNLLKGRFSPKCKWHSVLTTTCYWFSLPNSRRLKHTLFPALHLSPFAQY